uniref:Uncharacterized protein n=1 Tax=Onchocerca volvulus TaxID=6282 RepID=A0A8R1TUL8_ONCVO
MIESVKKWNFQEVAVRWLSRIKNKPSYTHVHILGSMHPFTTCHFHEMQHLLVGFLRIFL